MYKKAVHGAFKDDTCKLAMRRVGLMTIVTRIFVIIIFAKTANITEGNTSPKCHCAATCTDAHAQYHGQIYSLWRD